MALRSALHYLKLQLAAVSIEQTFPGCMGSLSDCCAFHPLSAEVECRICLLRMGRERGLGGQKRWPSSGERGSLGEEQHKIHVGLTLCLLVTAAERHPKICTTH